MAKEVKAGMTDYSVFVFIPDPASTDGSGKTGLVAANLTVSGSRMETDNDATVTDYTSSLNDLASLTAAHNDWGILEVSSTLAPGLYRLDIADAIFASGAWSAVVYVMITSSAAAASPIEFILVPQSPIDGVLLAPTTHTSAVIPTVTTTATATNVTTVNGLAAGVITAASIAADAITDAKVASDVTIASVTGAVGSVTGNVGGNVTGSVGSIATGGISAASFAAGAIDAAAIAANAIGASELAADAVAEIQSGLSTAADLATVAGYIDTEISTILSRLGTPSDLGSGASVAANLVDIEAQTDDIGAAGAGLTALATQASVNTIDDFLDTEIAAIKAKTDSLTFTTANQVDANCLAIDSSTAAADRLQRSAETIATAVVGAASTTTSIVTSSISPSAAVTDQFKGRIVIFDRATTTANLRGQATDITASTSGGVLTCTALTTAPASGDVFVIV